LEDLFYIIELSILGLFVVEIILHLWAYGLLYLRDTWNIFDIAVILISILFAILDIMVDNA